MRRRNATPKRPTKSGVRARATGSGRGVGGVGRGGTGAAGLGGSVGRIGSGTAIETELRFVFVDGAASGADLRHQPTAARNGRAWLRTLGRAIVSEFRSAPSSP